MQMKFTVKYEDGHEVEAVAKPKDFVAFERQYGVAFSAFTDEMNLHMEWMFYLAWSPLHRQGRETRAFDEFLGAVDDIDMQAEEPPTPLAPTPSLESSPS